MLQLKTIEYLGWPNCLQLSNDTVEMVITTDIGPRIVHFGWKGQEDKLFYIDPETRGHTGGDTWHLYGGHRLWHAPEIKPRTYVPDNSPVAHDWDGTTLKLVQDVEELTGLQKSLEIRLHETQSSVSITHKITNHGVWEANVAPWALSVLAPGGTAIIPQEPFVPFPDALLPARPLVLWQYTDMSDPRLSWQARYIALKQDPERPQQIKFGVRNSVGWGCYALGKTLFIKTCSLKPDAAYPDFGCNWEVFTDSHFLELETLGPLKPIAASGGIAKHEEEWSLAQIDLSMSIEDIYQHVQDLNAVTV